MSIGTKRCLRQLRKAVSDKRLGANNKVNRFSCGGGSGRTILGKSVNQAIGPPINHRQSLGAVSGGLADRGDGQVGGDPLSEAVFNHRGGVVFNGGGY